MITCAHAQATAFWPAASVHGAYDLSNMSVRELVDGPELWAVPARLNGFTYLEVSDRAGGAQRDRIRWLLKDPSGPTGQPFEHLAALLSSKGDQRAARAVRLSLRRWQTRKAGRMPWAWPGRLAGLFQDLISGYGYAPGRLLAWAYLFVIGGSIYFSFTPPSPAAGSAGRDFNALIFCIDLLIPTSPFGVAEHWAPDGPSRWVASAISVAGWVLAVVASTVPAFQHLPGFSSLSSLLGSSSSGKKD